MSTINSIPFRSTIFYRTDGTVAPIGTVFTISTNGLLNFSNSLSLNTLTASSITGNITTLSSITASTIFNAGNNIALGQSVAFPNRYLELGTDVVDSVYLDFHSKDSTLSDYSTRIQSLGGTTVGTGALNMMASTMGLMASSGVGIGTNAPGSTLEVYTNSGVGGTTQLNVTSFAGGSTTTNTSVLNLRIQGAGGGMVDNSISAQYNSSGVGTYSLAFKPQGTTVMSILGSGNVGIGATTPVGALSVILDGNGIYNTGSWSGSYALFGPGASSTSGSAVAITYNTTGLYGSLLSLSPGVAWRTMTYSSLYHTFYVSGTQAGYIDATGFHNGSDEREKINIKNINTDKSLQRILACTPKTFQRVMDRTDPMISDNVKNKWHIGLIAQEVLSINPHCISEWTNQDGDTRYGINYTDFVTHLIGSVKEIVKQSTLQEETIQTHESTIRSLQAQNATLQARMDALEALIRS